MWGSLTLRRAILHDEKAYPEPFKFKPERFLPVGDVKDIGINPDPIAMGAFGFGRRYVDTHILWWYTDCNRICPGRHFATSSTWIAMAYILSTFTISKFVDVDGNVVEPALEFTTGVVRWEAPRSCSVFMTAHPLDQSPQTIQSKIRNSKRPNPWFYRECTVGTGCVIYILQRSSILLN